MLNIPKNSVFEFKSKILFNDISYINNYKYFQINDSKSQLSRCHKKV